MGITIHYYTQRGAHLDPESAEEQYRSAVKVAEETALKHGWAYLGEERRQNEPCTEWLPDGGQLTTARSNGTVISDIWDQLGTTTTLTLLYDTPKEGSSRFGPYRAYRVRTPDGREHTFFPPRSLYPELDRLELRRGFCLSIRASQRVSDDGRVFPRFDIVSVSAPEGATLESPTPAAKPSPGKRSSMLACVALKAAASRNADEERAIPAADRYLEWLLLHA